MRIDLQDHHNGYYCISVFEIIGSLLFVYDIKMLEHDKHKKEGPYPTVNIWNPIVWALTFLLAIFDVTRNVFAALISSFRTNHKLRDADRLSRPYLIKILYQHVRKLALGDE